MGGPYVIYLVWILVVSHGLEEFLSLGAGQRVDIFVSIFFVVSHKMILWTSIEPDLIITTIESRV